jgi:hypothetical protein
MVALGVPPRQKARRITCYCFEFHTRGAMTARHKVSRSTERLPSRHRLGPGDMPLEAKRFRHVAVAVPEVAVGGFVAACPS